MKIVGGMGTNTRNMRNHNAKYHKSASFLIIADIYDTNIASFSGMNPMLRLP
jgi:hypothetical protein